MLAGGGIKLAHYGTSDELGYAAVNNPVSIQDFHATMLRVLGIDHMRMTVLRPRCPSLLLRQPRPDRHRILA